MFEQIVEQAFYRLQARLHLPIVHEWGRWEGKDRNGKSLEMDIAAALTDGRVLSGAVKWNTRPLDRKWHFHHLEMVDRLASSGVKWAHAANASDAPLLYVAAGGFAKEFEDAARASRQHVYLWTLADLYKPAARANRATR